MGLRQRTGNWFRTVLARVTRFGLGLSADRVGLWSPRSFGNIWMTPDEALRLSAVWACVTVISKSLASSRWEVFEEQLNGNREMRRNTTTYRLLNTRPNPEATAFSLHEAQLITALTWGNAYAEIERDQVNRPAALWPIENERCALKRNVSNELVLEVQNYDRGPTYLPYRDVYHIHGPGTDGLSGFDIVAYAARTLAHMKAADIFGYQYYAHGTAMGGTLSTDANWTKEQVEDLRKRIEDRHAGPENAFQFLILTGGMKYQTLSQTLDNAQYNESRYLLIEEVCRYYGVPPHKVAHLLRSTFSNIEHQGLEFVRDALTPWAERCAQECDFKLLPAVGRLKVRIDTDWLAEGDAMSKAQTDSILVNNALETRNEARKRRGKNTLGPIGDLLTVQGAMTTLERVKEAPAPTPASNGNGGLAGSPMPEEEERQIAAAQQLFAAALKRCLRRQHHRALDAESRAKDLADFEKRIAASQSGHLQYVNEQLDEVFAVLGRIQMVFNIAGLRQIVLERMNEDHNLLMRAYKAGSVGNWCDVDRRAEQIATELESYLKGVTAMHAFAGPPLPFKQRSADKPFYRMEKKDTVGDLYLYDLIGDSWDGTTAKQFAADLKALGEVKTLNIFINSPGGSVFDGVAIYNTLARHRARKIVHVDGLAGSIASVVAMVGDEIQIASNGIMMIHDAWGFAMGNSEDMRKIADNLDKINEVIVGTYVARSGSPEKEIRDYMHAETWFSAEEAIDVGLADTITDAVEAAALSKFDLTGFKHPPQLPAAAASKDSQPGGTPPASGWTPAPNLNIARANVRLARRKLQQQGQPST